MFAPFSLAEGLESVVVADMRRSVNDGPVVCLVCGKDITEGRRYRVYGGHVCQDCRELYSQCERCGGYYRTDGMRADENGNLFCGECYDYLYVPCAVCGETTLRIETFWMPEGRICRSCFEVRYTRCERCGHDIARDDAYIDDSGRTLCEECYNQERRVIHAYSYDPDKLFYGTDGESSDTLYMGMELEVAAGQEDDVDDVARSVQEFDSGQDEFYLKEDASVSHGFELVTMPRTYESWCEFVCRGTLGEVLAYMRRHNMKGHSDNAHIARGIHIHASLDPWTGAQLDVLYRLIYQAGNRDFVVSISQRKEGQLAEYARLNGFDEARDLDDVRGKRGNALRYRMDRYVALNMTGRTIEFRIFNSSIRPERVLKNIEFVQALYEYTAQNTSAKWEDYRDFVIGRKDRFGNLCAFMIEKGLYSPEEPADTAA
jgi:formylmethanofuran dehydrogenase subunit E